MVEFVAEAAPEFDRPGLADGEPLPHVSIEVDDASQRQCVPIAVRAHSCNGRDVACKWIVGEIADTLPPQLVSPATSPPTPAAPSGLITPRAVVPSKFRLESSPLCAVANCGEAPAYMLERTQYPGKFIRSYCDEFQNHRTSEILNA